MYYKKLLLTKIQKYLYTIHKNLLFTSKQQNRQLNRRINCTLTYQTSRQPSKKLKIYKITATKFSEKRDRLLKKKK